MFDSLFLLSVAAMRILLWRTLAPERVAGLGGLLECGCCGSVEWTSQHSVTGTACGRASLAPAGSQAYSLNCEVCSGSQAERDRQSFIGFSFNPLQTP
jgi:hypothetical protein